MVKKEKKDGRRLDGLVKRMEKREWEGENG